MRILLTTLLVAALPAVAADNAIERTGKRTGAAIERGAKRTEKAAERPRAATQKFLERSGRKIEKATGGR